MALFNEARLRALAKSRVIQLNESTATTFERNLRASAALSAFSIFLSHSYLDKELILGITVSLQALGYTVYVDWKDDDQLNRSTVTKGTAEVVRNRIIQSNSLFFATTDNAKDSKWMPWELGYMDGKKGRSAILPVSNAAAPTNTYKGQEYLGIYPYIVVDNDNRGRERLWVHEDATTYVTFDDWLLGTNPKKHG
jgi:hypothetical protein